MQFSLIKQNTVELNIQKRVQLNDITMPVNFYWGVIFSTTVILLFSPAGEIDLVSPKVDVGVREHFADFFEEAGHKVVCGVEDGVHRTKGTWKSAAWVAWSQKFGLT